MSERLEWVLCAVAALCVTAFSAPLRASEDGSALYATRCASCHESAVGRTPTRAMLGQHDASSIVSALTNGVMRAQTADLSEANIRALAAFLTQRVSNPTDDAALRPCRPNDTSEWNGWGRDTHNTRYQPSTQLTARTVRDLRPRWVFAYPGQRTWGQPTVVGQQVFVSSSTAKVFALDARTGKTIWEFDSAAPVRTAISVAQPVGSDCAGRIAYFGDQKANVYAVDANTGKELWRVTIDDFPGAVITGSPTLHAGRVYVPLSSSEEALAGFNPQYECCKFRGSIVALNAATGALLWKSYTIPDTPVPTRLNSVGTQMFGPAGAGVWSSPTIDARRNVLYVGTGNSYTEVDAKTADAILAFDLDTGTLKWSHQFTAQDNFIMMCEQPGVNNCPKVLGQDYDFGASPILQNLPGGKRLLLAGQKSGALYALDPDKSGELVWEAHLSPGSYLGGIQWGPAVDERTAYVAISDVVAGNGVPGLHALDIKDGRKLWSVPAPTPDCAWGTKGCSHAQSQALTVIPGVVFSGSIDGHMRAYDTRTGAILWDFDTARSFPAVNGATAQGGSLDGGGPAVAGGMLLVNSGYALVSGAPGNALIAFSTDDASAVVANADRGR